MFYFAGFYFLIANGMLNLYEVFVLSGMTFFYNTLCPTGKGAMNNPKKYLRKTYHVVVKVL